jgi:hypothetical protein
MTYLRFTEPEHRAMIRACRNFDPVCVNLLDFRWLLSISLADALPQLAWRIARLTGGQLRLLQEQMPSKLRPEFSAADVHTLTQMWPPLPLTSRFTRPLRQTLILCLMVTWPKLARKVGRLSGEAFDRLCDQLQGRRSTGA